ncbi:hypothetical protein [Streptomyces sp. NPDC057636]|uniref:hypothetical protein n=1 Tax=Streptomyces sp. NPDC057636 TaxID=3346189 RepID=UPI0036CF90C1
MRALRVKRIFAVTATGVLMAGGAAIGAAGTASANSGHHGSSYSDCNNDHHRWSWYNNGDWYSGHKYRHHDRGYDRGFYGRGYDRGFDRGDHGRGYDRGDYGRGFDYGGGRGGR